MKKLIIALLFATGMAMASCASNKPCPAYAQSPDYDNTEINS